MGLNIKNPTVETNIRKLAERTGQSLTDAIDHAVQEKLDRLERENAQNGPPAQTLEEFLEAIRPLQEELSAQQMDPNDNRTARELIEELYDEHGLPS